MSERIFLSKAISFLSKEFIRTEYDTPCSLAPALILAIHKALKALFLFFLSPIFYSYISISKDNKRTDYEGNEIAELVERRWGKNFSNEIMYVIGDEWHAGNLSYHLSNRPKWFLEINDKLESLDPKGGIVYTGNAEFLKSLCPGDFGKIDKQWFCMIGIRK